MDQTGLIHTAGLARNKLREKLTQLTEILVHGVSFSVPKQTVQTF